MSKSASLQKHIHLFLQYINSVNDSKNPKTVQILAACDKCDKMKLFSHFVLISFHIFLHPLKKALKYHKLYLIPTNYRRNQRKTGELKKKRYKPNKKNGTVFTMYTNSNTCFDMP